MSGVLGGRLAIVTGAARGIGRAIALGLAGAGADVLVTDVLEDALTETVALAKAEGVNAWGRRLDVTDLGECETLAQEVQRTAGQAAILVNNAGVIFPGRITDPTGPADWARTMAVNVDGVFNMARAFHPTLKETRGAVVNIASIRSFVAAGNAAAYAASKGAVMQLTKALAIEWGADGIRVNAIAPGFVDTQLVPAALKSPANRAVTIARTPQGRMGEPEEIAAAAVFLASPAASFITGAILAVDGGYLAA